MKFDLVCLDEVDSTNKRLLEATFEQYPLGTALLAKRQSAGHGRAERPWESANGGMYLSCLFKPHRTEALSLLGAFAVVEMCRRDFELDVQVRWPNDVYHNGRKLAGILPQVRFRGANLDRAVVGVGLNVSQPLSSFPTALEDKVTTLSHLLAEVLEVKSVARRFLHILEDELILYQEKGPGQLLRRCEKCLEGLCPSKMAFAVKESGEQRELGLVRGLGPVGELKVGAGELITNLGRDERLILSSTSPH